MPSAHTLVWCREEVEDEETGLLGKGADREKDMLEEEQPWYRNQPLLLTLVVTAWMLSISKYNDELGPVFVSAPVAQVRRMIVR